MDRKLSEAQMYLLREHLAHARRAFGLVVSNDFSGKSDLAIAIEHAPYAFGVYQAFQNSIGQVVEQLGLDPAFKDWTPKRTEPRDIKAFLLEEAVSSGLLSAWKNQLNNVAPDLVSSLQIRDEMFRKAVRASGTRSYSQIEGMAICFANTERAAEVMQVLGNTRRIYQGVLEFKK